MQNLVNFLLVAGSDLVIQNNDGILPTPEEWVQTNMIDFLLPAVVSFLAALAAISVFRSLMRF